jgi:hypothetical protein
MKSEEINIELESIEIILKELLNLYKEVLNNEPSIPKKTAAATFLAQIYRRIENILKRINRFYNISLPTGDIWHIDLFMRFCEPGLQAFTYVIR